MPRKKSRGFSQKRYKDEIREAGFHFVVMPLIIYMGVIVMGALLENPIGVSNATTQIFEKIGGIAFPASYILYVLKDRYGFDIIKYLPKK